MTIALLLDSVALVDNITVDIVVSEIGMLGNVVAKEMSSEDGVSSMGVDVGI